MAIGAEMATGAREMATGALAMATGTGWTRIPRLMAGVRASDGASTATGACPGGSRCGTPTAACGWTAVAAVAVPCCWSRGRWPRLAAAVAAGAAGGFWSPAG